MRRSRVQVTFPAPFFYLNFTSGQERTSKEGKQANRQGVVRPCGTILNQKILSQEYEGAKIVCDPFTHAENAIAVQKGKDDLLAFINECIDEYYADGTYDTLWTKWIDASGEGEEAAAAEDAETAE